MLETACSQGNCRTTPRPPSIDELWLSSAGGERVPGEDLAHGSGHRGLAILLLFAYPKNEQSDLSPSQIQVLKSIIDREFP